MSENLTTRDLREKLDEGLVALDMLVHYFDLVRSDLDEAETMQSDHMKRLVLRLMDEEFSKVLWPLGQAAARAKAEIEAYLETA